MPLSNIYNIFKTLEKENILLSFKGVVTADLLNSVLQIMESKLTYMDEAPRTKKKVFNVLVECLQNLYHHIDLDDTETTRNNGMIEAKSALLMIAQSEGSFYIKTGNYIDKGEAIKLEERLDSINGMTKEELRTYYQEILSDGTVSTKGTAGLGMIDIARKSGNKLQYDFVEVSEEIRFFCLNVKID